MVVTRNEWGGVEQGEADIFEPSLHHAADIVDVDCPSGEPALLFERALEKRRVFRRIAQVCCVDIGRDQLLQVAPDGDLARFAAFFGEVEHPLLPGMVEVAAPELGDGPGARAGIDENRKERPIAQADDMRGVERGEELPRLVDGDLRRLAFDGGVALAPDGEGGVEHDGVAGNHAVEEMAQCREMLIARGDARRFGQLLKILAHMPGSDLCQLPPRRVSRSRP